RLMRRRIAKGMPGFVAECHPAPSPQRQSVLLDEIWTISRGHAVGDRGILQRLRRKSQQLGFWCLTRAGETVLVLCSPGSPENNGVARLVAQGWQVGGRWQATCQ